MFDANALKEVKPDEFIGLGMKNSHVYRQLFTSLTRNWSARDRTWIIILATTVKNRERVLTELNSRFVETEWRNPVVQFFSNHTVTKCADILGNKNVIPVANIPSCTPDNRTFDNFVCNQWVAQLRVDDDTLQKQKAWESSFSENEVTSGGANYKRGFREDFWDTKSKDQYPLLNNMSRFEPEADGPYKQGDIERSRRGKSRRRRPRPRPSPPQWRMSR
ncbi:hypothetical protein FJT64_017836 [Amphibalanus amphitrite]|uniref:Uncharacterized protein n=1 Tax=Amphibalanus amphitrite TaxID=1232801 RepID=A0A6A4XAH8_AMPAM|nr:hypothetical protein FJT64_017836 [Amphibalanus amphitrite]